MTCCTLYSDRRNRLYQELNIIGNSNWLNSNTNEKKFCYLLQPKDIHTSKLVIAYIRECLEIRKADSHITIPVHP